MCAVEQKLPKGLPQGRQSLLSAKKGFRMVDLLELHKYFLSSHLKRGGVAADFTMGNGNDTLWLSRTVG